MRNHSLDTLKFICAVMVIFLHVNTPIQHYYLPLTRCAVPCFFILSGYFMMRDGCEERMWKSSSRMIKYILVYSLFYAVLHLVMNRGDIMTIIPSPHDWLCFLLFNENPWEFHLWYLNAYLYALLLCIVISKYNFWKEAYSFVPFLLILDLTFGKYSLLLLGREFPFIYVRNFLFVGVPYLLIGTYIRKYNQFENFRVEIICFFVAVFMFLSVFENRLLASINLNPIRDHYLSTTFLSVFLFVLFLKIHQNQDSWMSRLGKDSLHIYLLHPLWMILLPKVCNFMSGMWIVLFNYFAPIVVLSCTIVTTMLMRKLRIIK